MNELETYMGSVTRKLPKEFIRSLKALAEGYEKAGAYNKPAIEFYLRRVYAVFTSKT